MKGTGHLLDYWFSCRGRAKMSLKYEDRRDCYWLYIVTNHSSEPKLQDPIGDTARFQWNEVTKVAHYYLSVDAHTQPMQVCEDQAPYGEKEK